MPAGRPTTYRDEYCQQIIDFMAVGFSITAFAGHIGVCRDTITEWARVHPEFSSAVKRGKAQCALWWEIKNQTGVVENKGNPTLIIFGLKNMAPDDWSDRNVTKHVGADKEAGESDVGINVNVVSKLNLEGLDYDELSALSKALTGQLTTTDNQSGE
jgi:hypothetical protein